MTTPTTSQPDLLDKARTFGRAHPRSVILGVIVLALIVGLVLTIHGNATSGFHNMGTLQTSVTQQADSKLGPNDQIQRVICVSTGANSAQCNVTSKSAFDAPYTVNVSIASDGNSWVSSGAGN
jgi:hypothetical protein